MKCKNLICPPVEKVKIGLIGLGQRGMATLKRYNQVANAEVVAVSDLSFEAVERARQYIASTEGREVETFQGESQWRRLCEIPEVNLVYICTDWDSHPRMAIYAMQKGKHVAIEVPAAMSVRECWDLVMTAEETQRHCIMLENCCYDIFHLGILGMIKKGMFGEITHCEGAYIHKLNDADNWMSQTIRKHQGNPYPTHALGPVCQMLDINHGDRLCTLVSMSGLNQINDVLIKTEQGRSVLIQFDEGTPRPYSRIQMVCGTRGFARKYPRPTIQLNDSQPIIDDDAEVYAASFREDCYDDIISKGEKLGVSNIMNYTMDCRLVQALHEGKALDLSVYDAALWSCIAELSATSASQGSIPVEIPDFTRGEWK